MKNYAVDTISLNIAEKFCEAESKVSQERGDFTLFGLFELEELPGKWDLIAAASWLDGESNKIAALIETLQAVFPVKEWRIIAAVVPMLTSSDFVQAVTRKYDLEHGLEEIGNAYVNGAFINHAFLITSIPSPLDSPAGRRLDNHRERTTERRSRDESDLCPEPVHRSRRQPGHSRRAGHIRIRSTADPAPPPPALPQPGH